MSDFIGNYFSIGVVQVVEGGEIVLSEVAQSFHIGIICDLIFGDGETVGANELARFLGSGDGELDFRGESTSFLIFFTIVIIV